MEEEIAVVIVGAGPSGLATSACLSRFSIPNLVLEKEDCCASLWKKRTYDRLHLHLSKNFCQLPHMPHSPTSPTFMPKKYFIEYLDNYASHFNINPNFGRKVEDASYDNVGKKWIIRAKNVETGRIEVYKAKFLVVATGENGEGFLPWINGLDSFEGEVIHSSEYKSGLRYRGKNVLVVGCGNSGMEIAFDLSNFGSNVSIVARNRIHVLSKEITRAGMLLMKYLPVSLVDYLVTWASRLEYGNLSEFGLHRPAEGPFYLKTTAGKSPVLDVGTIQKIKAGDIQVLPAIESINGRKVIFENQIENEFDVLIFATGYKSTANNWLKGYKYVVNGDGMSKNDFPANWKGEKGLYCAGLSKRGLPGISQDAEAIAADISMVYHINC